MNSLHELQQLYDREFLEASYETLLGRRIDAEGLEATLGALREGVDRESILYSLATSPEGVGRHNDLPDWGPFLRLQKRLRSSPFAILLRPLYAVRRRRLQANRLENMLGRLESRLNNVEAKLATTEKAAETSQHTDEDAIANLIRSPHARDIFRRLSHPQAN